ncbi:hypothetical protein D3C83_210940 [compost metagenome]
MPKSIARATSRSIAASTSKSFGPAKNLFAPLAGVSIAKATNSRAASLVLAGGGTVSG